MRYVLALAGLLLVLPGSASAAPGKILVSGSCGEGSQRPKRIVLACGDGNALIEQIRWSRWGGRVAEGPGVYVRNTCDPFCAAGTFVRSPIRVRLYMRRACPGRTHLYYKRATLVEPSGRRSRIVLFCPVA